MQTITLSLPETTFHKLKRATEFNQRSINDLVVALIETLVPAQQVNDWTAMHFLSDADLWAAMQPMFSQNQQTRLHDLNHDAGERDLTELEQAEQNELLVAYHQAIIRRSQAMSILKLRGHTLPHEQPRHS